MNVKTIAKGYLVFVGFMLLTNMIVRPMAQKSGLPLISNI